MTQNDIPGGQGAPRGPVGVKGGSRLPPATKKILKQQIMAPNLGSRYPKCVLTKNGLC